MTRSPIELFWTAKNSKYCWIATFIVICFRFDLSFIARLGLWVGPSFFYWPSEKLDFVKVWSTHSADLVSPPLIEHTPH